MVSAVLHGEVLHRGGTARTRHISSETQINPMTKTASTHAIERRRLSFYNPSDFRSYHCAQFSRIPCVITSARQSVSGKSYRRLIQSDASASRHVNSAEATTSTMFSRRLTVTRLFPRLVALTNLPITGSQIQYQGLRAVQRRVLQETRAWDGPAMFQLPRFLFAIQCYLHRLMSVLVRGQGFLRPDV